MRWLVEPSEGEIFGFLRPAFFCIVWPMCVKKKGCFALSLLRI